ncbi:membrane protein insertase YidC [Halomonas binhaiensis]|uniref:Membrane protein insertase YidC n=1 Tax=Halomonas binhaiensis TaxID=2562282 RepID=A0A5C1NLP7_9GAMM|nr:membrane protein insertase YidC [Halomonas binhaiensis]QEM83661.1 membrane protein insertase YidC [Halomonas binhaiensis]
MDVKRLLLLIPLAVLAYLIMVQWNQDYGQTPSTPEAPAITSNASQDGSDDAGEGLAAPNADKDVAAELPTTDNAAVSKGRNLVAVVTDVLDLRIDPQGGDVVYAALPEHLMSQDGDRPYVLLASTNTLNYVARSGLQIDGHSGRIAFTPEKTEYRLVDGQDTMDVDMKATVNGVDVIKRFTFNRDDYAVKVSYLLDNGSDKPVTARFIGQLVRDSQPDPSVGPKMGMKSFLGAAYSSPDNRYEKVSFEDVQAHKFSNREAEGGWVAIIQHYFTSAWVPSQKQQNLFYATTDSQNRNVAAFAGQTETVAPGADATLGATLYMGPKVQERLEAIAPNLELTVDFGWLWFIANPLFWLLDHIHSLIGNWGWSIVILTIMVKTALWPLSAKAYRSMARMRKLGPEMQRLKERFGDDRQKMSQEMMKFYQKEKINPLGGCLPIVVQMPVFIALYWMLLESVELRHAPFMLWIQDLSVKDPYFILPILMGVSMYVQQLLNPTPPDPMQAKIMKLLPIVFTFFFLWFPAGLVIYWVCNNCISIIQQYLITRKIESDPSVGKGVAK